ncbi:hypothetical protein NC653_038874 [Populus alba x Populus x berolinensis]|uniref:Uncharacterized protein n=1 Tax=Populus alba x Populus x berolinensis TaxID=444605 RepID=A0AAD6PPV8_9ROSI|nr:hypothetical protein NC653_038874 [Populus alba x Populus x berolinensis]
MVAQKVSLQGMVVGVEEEAFTMAIPNVGGGQPMVTLAMRGGVGGEQTGEEPPPVVPVSVSPPPATNQSRTTTESALPRYEQIRISLDHYSRWNQPKREKKPFGLPELSSHRSPFMFVRAFTRPSLCERRDRDLIFGLLGSSRSLRIFAGPLAALACVLTRR